MIDGERITGYNIVNKEKEVGKMWNEIYRAITPEQWRQFLIACLVLSVIAVVLEIIQKSRK